MTAGITGVFWLPRMAEGNSIALNAGTHAIPMAAAATAWGTMAAAWGDATATVTRVLAELGVGMIGAGGLGALARLTGFNVFAGEQGLMAAAMGTKAATQATAYTVASLAMPSLPEIAAVEAARVAAHSTGGIMNGTAEAAEAAKAAMDLRAALTMEAYEAVVSAVVLTPTEFPPAPPIANGAGRADVPPPSDSATQAAGNPLQAAAGAATAVAQNPGVASTVTEAASVASSMASSGVSSASSVGEAAIAHMGASTTVNSTMSSAAPTVVSLGGLATVAAGVSTAAPSLQKGGLQLPSGWGSAPETGPPPALGATPAPVEGTEAAGPATSGNLTSGSPLGHSPGRSGDKNEEAEHATASYQKPADHFADGRAFMDGVLGADPHSDT